MINSTQLAAILRFIADTITVPEYRIAENQPGENPNAVPPVTEPAPAKRKGRPPGSTNAASPATEPVTPPAEPVVEEAAKPTVPPINGKTLEELRTLINPLIEKSRGLEVKKVLNKYAPPEFGASEENFYPLSQIAEHPEHHASFQKEIEALINF